MAEITYNATGRRKSSIARVIMKKGTGEIKINKKPVEVHFPRETLRMIIKQPLVRESVLYKGYFRPMNRGP